MRRQSVHLAFAAAALVFGALAGWQAARLHDAERVNRAIADARAASPESSAPEARFARALALARAGEHEDATKAYQAIVRGSRADLRLAALYNLGNLHLREALKNGPRDVLHALPLIELAKQSYRDALRDDPDDWDLRYNLERALWLAPEFVEPFGQEKSPERERAITTMPRHRIDLP